MQTKRWNLHFLVLRTASRNSSFIIIWLVTRISYLLLIYVRFGDGKTVREDKVCMCSRKSDISCRVKFRHASSRHTFSLKSKDAIHPIKRSEYLQGTRRLIKAYSIPHKKVYLVSLLQPALFFLFSRYQLSYLNAWIQEMLLYN